MSSGCIKGTPKRKASAPINFNMDTGVLCVAFGTNNVLCKFADFLFNFFLENYALQVAGFLIDPLIRIITDNQAVQGYYQTKAGKFDLAIATKAKALLEIIQTIGDVQQALDSLKLQEFDTDEFCASNPLFTPVQISYSQVLAAFVPFGTGFDDLLFAITKNWIIIKFAEYCECIPDPIFSTNLPPPPPPYRGLSSQSCIGDRDAQLSLDLVLANIDQKNAELAGNLAIQGQATFKLIGELPFEDGSQLWLQYVNSIGGQFPDYPAGFVDYYAQNQGVGLNIFAKDPDRLFGGDISDPDSGISVGVGFEFKSTFFQTPTPNPPGVSNQIFAPGDEPPCRCDLVISWEKIQVRQLSVNILVDGSMAIRRISSIQRGGWNPSDGTAVNNRIPRLGINAFAFPRLVLTNQSCPSYIVITDDDLLCRDLPDICTCKKVLKTAIVGVKTGCGINDQEDIEVFYEDYEGSTCEAQEIEVEVFDKCFEPLQTKSIIVKTFPNILT